MIEKPIGVYLNWASYDELSDRIELTEDLAMRQLNELGRLRDLGVQIDYYVMDAFWFAKDGGYRDWRKPHWPQGPDRWLEACARIGVKPGLWLGANNPAWMQVIPQWQDSFDPQTGCMCCFYGGFLPNYIETLHYWYEKGIRLFKFDFSDFSAAPPNIKESLLPSEIRTANVTAFRGALKGFRRTHSNVVLLAYNGFEERTIQNTTDEALAKVMDGRWLEVFDAIYCGDPRPSDIPAMNFWRSKDIYSDHMVCAYEQNDVPLRRIDNSGFMIGTTGTCYYRGSAAWKGMLALSLARGGRINTYYGNLDLLSDADGAWFAQIQRLFFDIQSSGQITTFGGTPGKGEPYGFNSSGPSGSLIAVVNPSQRPQTISVPCSDALSVLFTDNGFTPVTDDHSVLLGAEQLVLLGSGAYASLNLGYETDVHIPQSIEPLNVTFVPHGDTSIKAQIALTRPTRLRIVFEQKDRAGRVVRTSGGSPPDGQSLGHLLCIQVVQAGKLLPITLNYDKVIWSGLSWAVGEVTVSDLTTDVMIVCSTQEKKPIQLVGSVYSVRYDAD